LKTGISIMALEENKSARTVWAIALTAMGLLLCIKTPYLLRQLPEPSFLNFARYFIAALLIFGGVKRLYSLYFSKPENSSHED
jgi:hypothetical protein